MTKTVDLRVLVSDDLDTEQFIWYLLGKMPHGPEVSGEVVGAAELDKDGVPIPRFPVREGVEWDGWPRIPTHYSMSMPPDPDMQGTSEYRQTVKVYEHDGVKNTIVAAETVIVRNGQPERVRITGEDGQTVYVSTSDWVGGVSDTWDCSARIEVKP